MSATIQQDLIMLIDEIFENNNEPTSYNKLSTYLTEKFPDVFKYIKNGSCMNVDINDGKHDEHRFIIVFDRQSNNELYQSFRRNLVNTLRNLGYSADNYVVGGIGQVFEIRSKEYGTFFREVLEERRNRMLSKQIK